MRDLLNTRLLIAVGLLATLIASAKTCYAAEKMTSKEITFVRHGQTDWSLDLILQGPADPALNDVGRQTIVKTATYLKTLPKTWVMWSSPYVRTSQTATILMEQGVSISNHVVKDNIKERYFGDFRLHAELPPDQESDEMFTLRIKQALTDLETETETVLMVAHGKVFEKLCELLGVKPSSKIDFGDVFHFTRRDGAWSIAGPGTT